MLLCVFECYYVESTERREYPIIQVILVLCSGLAHAVWNMLAKKSTDKAVFLWAIYAPTTALLLPILIIELTNAAFSVREWTMLALSLLMQALYSSLLANTYKTGELSQVYPILRGTSTLLIPLIGVLVLREVLSLWGWIGINCMLVGFIIMVKNDVAASHPSPTSSSKPVLLAIAVGLCITTYTIIDKVNLQYLSPVALLEVTNTGFMLGLTPSVLQANRLKQAIRHHKHIIWIGAILSPGSYLLFLFAARSANISTIAPIREIGIVFGTLLGLFVLRESQGMRRIVASIVVVSGIIIIAISSH
ncbi:DMT family transporter [Sporosarcina sp. Te-1]|uniref:DMT family transporter n=1 Tax=Sporosarcina sp. Te-1 TaxID=2818390 RepID=UPI0021134F6E|nr:DMT family transporter [Sporosarcina sp. Te-1]